MTHGQDGRSRVLMLWLCCSTLMASSCNNDPERSDLPETVPAPSVSFPVEGEPPGQLELNELLVGAKLDAATQRLEAAGWTVRGYDLDDPDAGVTDDLRDDRVTVEYSEGRVVRIVIG